MRSCSFLDLCAFLVSLERTPKAYQWVCDPHASVGRGTGTMQILRDGHRSRHAPVCLFVLIDVLPVLAGRVAEPNTAPGVLAIPRMSHAPSLDRRL
jgi:ribosomal protein L24E